MVLAGITMDFCSLSQSLLESEGLDNKTKKYTFLDLVKTPNMRKLVICSGILWYGLNTLGMNVEVQGGHTHLDMHQDKND